MTGTLSVLQWNCRSIHGKEELLVQHIKDTRSDISVLALQSVGTITKALPNINGFHYPPFLTKEDNKIRTATYIKVGLTTNFIKQLDHSIGHEISLQTKNSKIVNIYNIYLPKGPISEQDVNWLRTTEQNNTIIVGDFNCHHPEWEPDCPEARVKTSDKLINALDQTDLVLLNEKCITRLPDNPKNLPSAIDLSFSSADIAMTTSWCRGESPLNSDHFPILITTVMDKIYADNDSCDDVKFNFKKANWEHFKDILSKQTYPAPQGDADEWYAQFNNIVIDAAKKSIPTYGTNKDKCQNKWWTHKCKLAQREYRSSVRKYLKQKNESSFTNMKNHRAMYNQTLANAKVEYWSKYLQKNVENYHDTTKLWKKLKEYKKAKIPPEKPLKFNGSYTRTPLEKAEVMAQSFAAVSNTVNLPKEAKEYREENKIEITKPALNTTTDNPLTYAEFIFAIKAIKNPNKSTGKDQLSYRLLLNLPPAAKIALFNFYQECWTNGTIPSAWKQGTVIPILKPKKNSADPSSYRPITLTPHTGKLYERIIQRRLVHHLQSNNIIPKLQAGFRSKRGCQEHIFSLSSHAKKAVAHNKMLAAVFFDIRKAFDTVWHNKLLSKLADIRVGRRILQFVENFLVNRTIIVKVNKSLSNPYTIDMGVPQGSVIAPILFNIMLKDINQLAANPNVHILAYADDIAIFCKTSFSNVDNTVQTRLQQTINNVSEYMTTNGFTLAKEKTQLIVFRRTRKSTAGLILKINNYKLIPQKEVTYLGVTFDCHLTWKTHINNLITKSRKSKSLINMIKFDKTISSFQNLQHLLFALVRSRLCYGHEAFFGALPRTINKLYTCESGIIKQTLGFSQRTSPAYVYNELDVLPLEQYLKYLTSTSLCRLKKVDNLLEAELDANFIASSARRSQLQKKKPMADAYSRSTVEECYETLVNSQINLNDINQTEITMTPPWLEPEINVKTEYENYTKKDNINIVKQRALETIDSYNNARIIYTDGSKLENGKCGCAFYDSLDQTRFKARLSNDIAISQAELLAIKEALRHAAEINCELHVVIAGDSKPALQTLLLPTDKANPEDTATIAEIKNHINALKDSNREVDFLWIPSHTGIKGNEIADTLAKAATYLDNITLHAPPISNFKFKIKQTVKKEFKMKVNALADARGWCDSGTRSNKYSLFGINRPFRELFARCRANEGKIFPVTLKCSCGSDIKPDHLLGCNENRTTFARTLGFMEKNNLPIEINSVTSNRADHSVTLTFMNELAQSKYGPYI